MAYVKPNTIDSGPSGDTVKLGITKNDGNVDDLYTNLNAYATSAITFTNKTISAGTLTGSITATGATITGATITGATIQTSTLTGTITASGATITGGTSVNMTIQTPTLSVGSDANGDMYYNFSSTLMRLAKGSAHDKLFMDPTGAIPEWACGIYTSYTTRDISVTGDHSIASFGFKPKYVKLSVSLQNAAPVSIGETSGDVGTCVYSDYVVAAGNWDGLATKLIHLETASGVYAEAVWKSFDTDGITITWSKTGTPTGTVLINIFALR